MPIPVCREWVKAMRVSCDMRALATDQWFERGLSEIRGDVSRGGVERAACKRFTARQQRTDISNRHSRDETVPGSERINRFREPIQRVSMFVKDPFTKLRINYVRGYDADWHDPRAWRNVPARRMRYGIILSRCGVRDQKKLAYRDNDDISAHESE
jgi:hypothetical protein